MGVYKICIFKGCRYGDHRCAHPWWFDVMRQGVRHRMSVDEYAAPRGATSIVRTKEEAKEWLARILRWSPLLQRHTNRDRFL